jgi:hypothetical protein
MEFTVGLFPETLPQKFAIKLQLQTFAISPFRFSKKIRDSGRCKKRSHRSFNYMVVQYNPACFYKSLAVNSNCFFVWVL